MSLSRCELQTTIHEEGKASFINIRLKPAYRTDAAIENITQEIEKSAPFVSVMRSDAFIAEKTRFIVVGEKFSLLISIITIIAVALGLANTMLRLVGLSGIAHGHMDFDIMDPPALGGHGQQLIDEHPIVRIEKVVEIFADERFRLGADHGAGCAGGEQNAPRLVEFDQGVGPTERKGNKFIACATHYAPNPVTLQWFNGSLAPAQVPASHNRTELAPIAAKIAQCGLLSAGCLPVVTTIRKD